MNGFKWKFIWFGYTLHLLFEMKLSIQLKFRSLFTVMKNPRFLYIYMSEIIKQWRLKNVKKSNKQTKIVYLLNVDRIFNIDGSLKQQRFVMFMINYRIDDFITINRHIPSHSNVIITMNFYRLQTSSNRKNKINKKRVKKNFYNKST